MSFLVPIERQRDEKSERNFSDINPDFSPAGRLVVTLLSTSIRRNERDPTFFPAEYSPAHRRLDNQREK